MKNNKLKWLRELFSDETGFISSKRLVGILCGIALCYTLIATSYNVAGVAPPTYIVEAVALLAFGCLGLSSMDKLVKAYRDKGKCKNKEENEEKQ